MIILLLLITMIMSSSLVVYNSANTGILDRAQNAANQTVVEAFNEPLYIYQGEQLGSDVKTLISMLETNAENNIESEELLPDIEYISGDGPVVDSSLEFIVSDAYDTNSDLISQLYRIILNTHYYNVEMEYDDLTGYINKIII